MLILAKKCSALCSGWQQDLNVGVNDDGNYEHNTMLQYLGPVDAPNAQNQQNYQNFVADAVANGFAAARENGRAGNDDA